MNAGDKINTINEEEDFCESCKSRAADSTNLSQIAKFTNLTIFDKGFCEPKGITKPVRWAIILQEPQQEAGYEFVKLFPSLPG